MKRCAYAIALFTCLASTALAREWVDAAGSQRIEAELLRYQEQKVWLRDARGVTYSCKWDRLSEADQEHVRQQLANSAVGELPEPSAPAMVLSVAEQAPPRRSTDLDDLLPRSPARTPGGEPGAMPDNSDPLTRDPLTRDPLLDRPARPAAPLPTEEMAPPTLPSGENAAKKPVDGKIRKRVFAGCKSNFLLYGDTGVGLYWAWGSNGVGRHYLALLDYDSKTSNGYLLYDSTGEGGIVQWAFPDYQAPICGVNDVYYKRKGGAWIRYESTFREVPR